MAKERATKQEDVSERYGRPAWLYSDGSVRGERGKMILALAGRVPFTHESAREAAPLAAISRVERKRDVVTQAANMAATDARFKRFGDMAHVAEIAYHAQKRAADKNDKQMVDAARFVYQEAGLSEKDQPEERVVVHEHTLSPGAVAVLLELASRRDVIDAEVKE